MISLTQKVKAELSAAEISDAAGALAELSAIISAAGSLGINSLGYYVSAVGGSVLKERADMLLQKLYGLSSDGEEAETGLKNQSGAFRITGAAAERVLEDCEILTRDEDGLLVIQRGAAPYLVMDENEAKRYLAGAFIAAGSINAPAPDGGSRKSPDIGYHFEIAVDSGELAEGLKKISADFGIFLKETIRRGKFVVYLKDNRQICDFLALIGACDASLDLASLAADKALHNAVNRRTNCEEANIGRTVGAAAKQLDAVKRLSERGKLSALPENLRLLAEARLRHPELGMAELGALLKPPLSKSGVNHRFDKIFVLAGKNQMTRDK